MTARRIRRRRYRPTVTLRPVVELVACHCGGSHYPGNVAYCVQRKTERLALR